jgi:hypothetical protein
MLGRSSSCIILFLKVPRRLKLSLLLRWFRRYQTERFAGQLRFFHFAFDDCLVLFTAVNVAA